MAAAEVLNEGVPPDHYARRAIRLQPAHRSEPCLEPAVVASDAVVLVRPVLCNEAGISSSITLANAGARSVMTSPGSP